MAEEYVPSSQPLGERLDGSVPPVLAHMVVFALAGAISAFLALEAFVHAYQAWFSKPQTIGAGLLLGTIVFGSTLGIIDKKRRRLRASHSLRCITFAVIYGAVLVWGWEGMFWSEFGGAGSLFFAGMWSFLAPIISGSIVLRLENRSKRAL